MASRNQSAKQRPRETLRRHLPRLVGNAIGAAVGTLSLIWVGLEVADYFNLALGSFEQSGPVGYVLLLLASALVGMIAAFRGLYTVFRSEWSAQDHTFRFWHSILERDRQDLDVRGMLSKSEQRIFLSGVALTYIVWHCDQELRDALDRGVRIDFVIAKNTEQTRAFYSRFSKAADEDLKAAHSRFKRFHDSLPEAHKRRMRVYTTDIPLTHSIGQYDDRICVSEFCLGSASVHVPSYCLVPDAPCYEVFVKEMDILLSESDLMLGDTGKLEATPQREFSDRDLAIWRALNETCWVDSYWPDSDGDHEHYAIWEEANVEHFSTLIAIESPPDFKLLYDSYLWRLVLQDFASVDTCGHVLELLPGKSVTIPIALEGLGFQGVLDRVDFGPEFELSNMFSFDAEWISCDLRALGTRVSRYDLLVGNHIVDDLLFSLHFPPAGEADFYARPDYVDPHRSMLAWREISSSRELDRHSIRIARLFSSLVEKMETGSTLVLRQYPSTFALLTGDVNRIDITMQVFKDIADAVSLAETFQVELPDISDAPVAPGSKYPNSFLVVRKSR